jgi:hypothetical protein
VLFRDVRKVGGRAFSYSVSHQIDFQCNCILDGSQGRTVTEVFGAIEGSTNAIGSVVSFIDETVVDEREAALFMTNVVSNTVRCMFSARCRMKLCLCLPDHECGRGSASITCTDSRI